MTLNEETGEIVLDIAMLMAVCRAGAVATEMTQICRKSRRNPSGPNPSDPQPFRPPTLQAPKWSNVAETPKHKFWPNSVWPNPVKKKKGQIRSVSVDQMRLRPTMQQTNWDECTATQVRDLAVALQNIFTSMSLTIQTSRWLRIATWPHCLVGTSIVFCSRCTTRNVMERDAT